MSSCSVAAKRQIYFLTV